MNDTQSRDILAFSFLLSRWPGQGFSETYEKVLGRWLVSPYVTAGRAGSISVTWSYRIRTALLYAYRAEFRAVGKCTLTVHCAPNQCLSLLGPNQTNTGTRSLAFPFYLATTVMAWPNYS
ncbi:MAG: hypothetical protein HQK59_04240 [Deltaproteobacteria bacterium]|nr:hypothetical protein [Deltaproteobacteria bacterium]MBF0525347.1 hypothetical protein [Deltaproteobacteria bacterium]